MKSPLSPLIIPGKYPELIKMYFCVIEVFLFSFVGFIIFRLLLVSYDYILFLISQKCDTGIALKHRSGDLPSAKK